MELFTSFLIDECSRTNTFMRTVIECNKFEEHVLVASCLMENSSTKVYINEYKWVWFVNKPKVGGASTRKTRNFRLAISPIFLRLLSCKTIII